MKHLAVIVLLALPSVSLADINSFRLKTLLEICDAAQQSSDLGTVKNIANQINNFERPSERSLATKYDQCLLFAFGKPKKSPSPFALLSRIEEAAIQLKKDCRDLLKAAPSLAVSNPICKDIPLR